MAAVVIKGFAGMRPAINPRLLETGEAQLAKNAKLNNGSLRAMKNTTTVTALASAVQTIFRYGDEALENQYWLTFSGDVDVMKSPVHSDQYRRLYWTGDSFPKYAPEDVFLGLGSLPSASYRLGIPKPAAKAVAAGEAPPVYVRERRQYVITYVKGTGEETPPSDNFTVAAVDGFEVAITGIPVPALSSGYVSKNIYRRDASVNESVYRLVDNINADVTEYTDEVENADLGAELTTDSVLKVPVASSAPIGTHNPVALTGSATPRNYAYAFGGYNIGEGTYVDEDSLSQTATVTVDKTQPVTISNFEVPPLGAQYIRIYRQDSSAGSYVRIAQIPISQSTYIDSVETPIGTGPAATYSSVSKAAPSLSAGASTAVTTSGLKPFIYCITYTTDGVEGKRSAESNLVRINEGTTVVTLTLPTPPTTADSVSIYRRTGTITNGLMSGSEDDYKRLATLPASSLTYSDQAPQASVNGNPSLPIASYGTYISPGGVFASAQLPADIVPETRLYVYTYVSAYGEEGPPSDPTDSIDIDPANPVTLSGMATAPTGPYNMVSKRIYRSSTGNQSTAFQFVAEIDVAITSYEDSVEQADLGETLQTESWIAPPAEMVGLTLGANGIAAGFVDKTVHLSEAFMPHAWPAKYQQTTEHKVVGLAAFQQSFAVLTTSYPYVLSGADPAAMSMIKLEAPQACVSKRSICSTGTGVVYASPDGLVSIGSEGIQLLTKGLLSRDQWQAYNPSSMMIKQYNQKIYVFHSTGLIVFDFTGESASMTVFDQTASAAYHDALLDALFIVSGQTIRRWDNGDPLTYTWKSKLMTMPVPVNFAFAQVEADAYPVTMRVYAGGQLKHNQVVNDRNPFRLPSGFKEKDWEIQLEGTGQVFATGMAETIHELRAA